MTAEVTSLKSRPFGSSPLSHKAAILLISALALLLLLVQLGTGDTVDMMELFNLVPVHEAYRDGHWLMPTLNGMPRLEKPPLPVWIIAGTASALRSDALWVLRFPAILVALLSAFAVYGLGCTLFRNPDDPPGRERTFALLAAVFLPAMLVFNREARLATYDIFSTGFLTVGAVLLVYLAETGAPDRHAHHPLTFAPRALWTLLAGIAVGLSILSKGPVPAATVMLPIGVWLLLFHRRRAIWLQVAAAALVSMLVFLPWLLIIGGVPGLFAGQLPQAWETWRHEFLQFGTGQSFNAQQRPQEFHKDWFYYVQIFYWVAPVVPLFIAGLFLPFLKSTGQPAATRPEVRGRWLLWIVVVGGVLILSLFSEKKPRYALQVFPFAALLSAAAWQELSRWPKNRPINAGAAAVLGAQALFFILPALVGLAALAALAIARGHVAPWAGGEKTAELTAALGPFGLFFAAAMFLALLLLGIRLWQQQFRHLFLPATALLAAAVCLLTFAAQWIYRVAPWNHTNPARLLAQTAARDTAGSPVFTFPAADARPWLSTLYYFNRIIPQLPPEQIASETSKSPDQPVYLFTVVSSGGKPVPHVAADIAHIAALTHRRPRVVLTLIDENRKTELIRLETAR